MSDMDRLVAQLRAAGCVFAEDEAQLLREASAGDEARLNELASRRCAGEPLHQVVGWAQFADIRVSLRPGVFVPRPRTEALVAHALRRCTQAAPIVVDLCCGSGALGIAFAAGCPAATLHATDIDEAALACARENVGARGDVHGGDLFDALPADLRGRIDVLLANVPYVPTTQLELMPVDARAHERRITLDGGDDGLDVLRRVAAGASAWLAPGGFVACETAAHQVAAARASFTAADLDVQLVIDEELDAHILVASRVSGDACRR